MTTLEIGPFHAGEIPPNLVVTFEKSDGSPQDWSAGGPWTAKFQFRSYGGSWTVKDPTPLHPNANDGKVTYVWGATDCASAGDYEGELWVGNSNGGRFDSRRIVWQVLPATVPSGV